MTWSDAASATCLVLLLLVGIAVLPRQRAARPEPITDEYRGMGRTQSTPTTIEEVEALCVLGLQPGVTTKEIVAAHRKKMLTAHPDLGGSADEAARLNQARDLLLTGQVDR